MNNKSIGALLLLGSSLCAHREVVRDVARDIQQSDYKSAKLHLTRLNREDLSKEQQAPLLKDLKDYAKEVKSAREASVTLSNSRVDSLTALGGLLLSLHGVNSFSIPSQGGNSQLRRKGDNSQLSRKRKSSKGLLTQVLGTLEICLGAYMTYHGYKCWYQKRRSADAGKVKELLDATYSEVKEG